MFNKMNCWEYHKCDCEGSAFTCPVYSTTYADGINKGINAGRCCWAIAGTMCKGAVQGTYAQKLKDCVKCTFFQKVQEEENYHFSIFGEVIQRQKKLKDNI